LDLDWSGRAKVPVREDVDALLSQLAPFDAKLRPPDLGDRMVQRSALSQRTIARTDIVILTAGAGYGKTTLLAQSVQSSLPWAWLTLHQEDNDPATLVAYLLRALQTAWELPAQQLEHFSDPGGSEASVLLPRLARLIKAIPRPGVLVLDEIDAIEDTRCLRVLETVLESAPDGMHILLSGRTVPPLGLDRLTKRSILELDEDDLVFSYDESLDLIASAQLQIDPRSVRRIHRAAEGWPTGIYLMALASQGSGTLPSPALPVADYVRTQILSGLSSRTREFLLRTSILDLQDGPSCDALLGRDDSVVMLARLSESHLFVTPVDRARGWYRYHGLLGDVLRSELQHSHPEELPLLHARASRHFAARSEREAAVRHALAANDPVQAAELVWGYVPIMLGIGMGDTLSSWLRGLEEHDYEVRPVFAVVRALASSLSGDGRQARRWLDVAGRQRPGSLMPDGTALEFYVKMIEALVCDNGVRAMVRAAHEALQIDIGDSPFRCIPLHLEGCGMAMLGDLDAAVPLLDESIDIGYLYPAAAVSGFTQKAAIAMLTGDWSDARRFVERGREIYQRFRLENVPTQAPFSAVAAAVAANDGDTEAAAAYAAKGRVLVARLVDMAPWQGIETRLILGQVEHRLGRQAAAAQLAKEAASELERLPDAVSLIRNLLAFENVLGSVETPSEALTTAEIRLLSFLPTHLTFGQIAEELFVSVNTVKSQAKAVYRKLDVMSRGEAVDRATTLGLLTS
jgi:LuxR family maltose regulon positive regulatory protein